MANTGAGAPASTETKIKNHYDAVLRLDSFIIWEGPTTTAFPKRIPSGGEGTFKHTAIGCGGSVGGLKYQICDGKKSKLIFAWSNKHGQHNKVYTKIFSEEEVVSWNEIKASLDKCGQSSTDEKAGVSSVFSIDATSNAAKATATVNQQLQFQARPKAEASAN